MTPGPRRGPLHLAALAASALALTGAGVFVERSDLFPRLRFAVQRAAVELPSTLAVDPREVVRGLPILSVYLDAADLSDLLNNKFEHGRRWERRSTVSYFDNGRLRFSGAAGVRVHGGGSRQVSPRQGFRLFFRRRYGFTQFGQGVLFGPASQPLQRLVVHNDVRTDSDGTEWRLVNPLAYDLSRRIGCIAPDTEPARLVLNGEDQGLYVLTEHFDDEYFASHMPGRRITMELAGMVDLRARLEAMQPLTLEKTRQLIDMNNLVNWFLSVVFSGTRDPYQGPGQFLDEDRKGGGWFWVNWDMDQSFRNWDMDSYQYLLDFVGERPRGRRPSEPRPLVMGTLLSEDAAFREHFAARIDEMLNHQLTREFLEERRVYYLDVALAYNAPQSASQRRIEEFLARRAAYVRATSEQWLNVSPSVPVTARRSGRGPLQVDGYIKQGTYQGSYFKGREVVLRIPNGGAARWIVNGSAYSEGTELRVRADRPLAIVALDPGSTAVAEQLDRPQPQTPPSAAVGSAPDRPLEWQAIPRPDRPYAMTTTEATVGHYRAFAQSTGRTVPRQPLWEEGGNNFPVVNLTFSEAVAFCAWAGGRLPTGDEWEFAARAGARTVYPWGDAFKPEMTNARLTGGRDTFIYTSPVASFPPNAFGLYDMIGNVWEWTSDRYRTGATEGEESSAENPAWDLRTVRGGSWVNHGENIRIANRVGLSATGRQNLYVGIRCVR